MEIITKHYRTYRFDELNSKAQARVLDQYRDYNVDYDWWNSCYESAKEAGEWLGIEINDICFALHVQGAGACLIGSYQYHADAIEKIRAEFPQDTVLNTIAADLERIQQPVDFLLTAKITHRYRGEHSGCTGIEVYEDEGDASPECEKELTATLRRFMDWIYEMLDEEHQYRVSDEGVKEAIESNDLRFLETGKEFNG